MFFNLQSPLICSRKHPWCRPWLQYRRDPLPSLISPGGAAAAELTALPGPGRCAQPPGQAPAEAAWRWGCAWCVAWTGNGETRMMARATWVPSWRLGGRAAPPRQTRQWWYSGTAGQEPTTAQATRVPTTCCFMIMLKLVSTHSKTSGQLELLQYECQYELWYLG